MILNKNKAIINLLVPKKAKKRNLFKWQKNIANIGDKPLWSEKSSKNDANKR